MASEIRFDKFSNLCSLGPRPIIVTGFLRQWFIQHFSEATTIEHPELRGLLWEHVESSKILIESITRWLPSMTAKRPGIIIKRNDWKILRWGIDDKNMGTIKRDGYGHHETGIEGSHTLFCLSHNAAEAEILAAEVYREMMQFGPVVRRELDIKRFMVLGVSGLFQVENSHQTYGVGVTVAYGLSEAWALVPHTPFLKRFVIEAFLP